jgi:hypothetical protein
MPSGNPEKFEGRRRMNLMLYVWLIAGTECRVMFITAPHDDFKLPEILQIFSRQFLPFIQKPPP